MSKKAQHYIKVELQNTSILLQDQSKKKPKTNTQNKPPNPKFSNVTDVINNRLSSILCRKHIAATINTQHSHSSTL